MTANAERGAKDFSVVTLFPAPGALTQRTVSQGQVLSLKEIVCPRGTESGDKGQRPAGDRGRRRRGREPGRGLKGGKGEG